MTFADVAGLVLILNPVLQGTAVLFIDSANNLIFVTIKKVIIRNFLIFASTISIILYILPAQKSTYPIQKHWCKALKICASPIPKRIFTILDH